MQGRGIYTTHYRQSSGPSTAHSMHPSPGGFTYQQTTGGTSGAVQSRKRSAPSDPILTPAIGRPLMPKQPSTFPTESGARPTITGPLGHQPISPLVEPPPTVNEPRKKRGRPTKKEAEDRRRAMEERQQARIAASQITTGSYDSPYVPPQLQAFPNAPPTSIPREETPGISAVALAPTAMMQTPQQAAPSPEQNSSGSSGKKRKARPRPISVSDPEPPLQPSFALLGQQGSSAYSSPPTTGSHRERRASVSARTSGPTSGPQSSLNEQEGTRPNAPEDPRAQMQRSRVWEDTVMGRPGQ